MQLSHSHKKFIKKNINKANIEEISNNSGLDQQEILKYLKSIWKQEKYEKYLSGINIKASFTSGFKLLEWLNAEKIVLYALFLLVFVTYINSLNNGFVSDDIGSITQNPYMRSWYLDSLNGSITYVIYYLLYKVFGASEFVFRFMNILFHFGNVVLIYLIFQKLFSKQLGIFVASLFAVHPILSESVTWISGGPYNRYTFFFLVSFAIYILYARSVKNILVSVFFFILAILTNEKAVPLFLVFPLYDFIFTGFSNKHYKNYVPYMLVVTIYSLTFFSMIGKRAVGLKQDYYSQDPSSTIFTEKLLQIPVAVSEYFRMIFWPTGLTLYHSELSFSNGELLLRSIILAVFIVFVLFAYFRFKNLFVFFWGSFFFISLAVTLLPLGIAWIVAERYVYIGSISIFAIVGYYLDKMSKNESLRFLVYTVFAVAVVALSIRTIIRNQDWRNEDTLWIATAKTSPSSPNTHNNMGDVYSRRGDFDNAIKEFSWAIDINPRYADAYHNRGSAYQSIGDIESATQDYQTALNINPNLWQSAQNLASIYFDKQDYDSAAKYMEYAFSKNQSINLAYNLAITYSKIGKLEEARLLLNQILINDPSNTSAHSLLSDIGY